ncbi:MAG: SMC-Scp complex subunit ScpB [Planctomycetota bacterium]|nr:MAG: SMC-Scp complex subunit ScpB [Planctomycetota bacterium]
MWLTAATAAERPLGPREPMIPMRARSESPPSAPRRSTSSETGLGRNGLVGLSFGKPARSGRSVPSGPPVRLCPRSRRPDAEDPHERQRAATTGQTGGKRPRNEVMDDHSPHASHASSDGSVHRERRDPPEGTAGTAVPHPGSDSATEASGWDLNDLEAAYRQALAATEFLEEELVSALRSAGAAEADDTPVNSNDIGHSPGPTSSEPALGPAALPTAARHGDASDPATNATDAARTAAASTHPAAVGREDTPGAVIDLGEAPRRAPRADPLHVIEAVLFVGGRSFTARRLAALLGDDGQVEAVEALIEQLRERYWRQRRPYTIRLEEGGYRMVLRSEFEKYRERTYGLTPREVKLSPETLAVLAAVAYRQPIGRRELNELCGQKTSGPLRQLVRLGLVALRRDEATRQVSYHTTDRFLELFGLRRIEDLPEPEDLEFK